MTLEPLVATASDASPSRIGQVLIVYPLCLDHVGHGNIQRILAIAKYLAASGFEVDLAYQGNPRVAPVEAQYSLFRRVYRVEADMPSSDDELCTQRLNAFYSGHDLPALYQRPSSALTMLVRSLLEAEPYQAVVATYAWTAPAFAGLTRDVLRVCDVQDILHQHAEACSRATGEATSFALPTATEEFLWRQFDVLLAITPEDEIRISHVTLPHQHVLTVRHAVPTANAASLGADDVALYAGSDNLPNVQALSWLLERVWAAVRRVRPSARLRIAGLIGRALPESMLGVAGVEVLGFQPSLSDEVERCGVFVAPYLYGSGLKIKVVEAASRGKAIVTTRAGVHGSGLTSGRSLEVHDDPEAFAEALVQLLGTRSLRESRASAALAEATACFSREGCYGPVASIVRLLGASTQTPAGHGIRPEVISRIQATCEQVAPERVVLWGNGGHTRALVAALHGTDVSVALIIDGRTRSAGSDPSGLPVIPASAFSPKPRDLVVLSSETFEDEMWTDLAAFRDGGGSVLGLYDSRLVSRAVVDRLSSPVRMRLGLAPFAGRVSNRRTVTFWDSQARVDRWWRLNALAELGAASNRRSLDTVIVSHRSVASSMPALNDLPETASVAPILEIDRRVVCSDAQVGRRASARVESLAVTTTSRALATMTFRDDDVLVLVTPSPSECLGIAKGLREKGLSERPAIALYGFADAASWSDPSSFYGNRRTTWRFAEDVLAAAAGNRVTFLASDPHVAAEIETWTNRTVHTVGYPVPAVDSKGGRVKVGAIRRVVCFSHGGASQVRPLLEALANEAHDGALPRTALSWRTHYRDARLASDEQWRYGLASFLDVDLIDDQPASATYAVLSNADVVVVLNDTEDEGWVEAVCVHATAAGTQTLVPAGSMVARWLEARSVESRMFAPGDAVDLIRQLRRYFDDGHEGQPDPAHGQLMAGVACFAPDDVLGHLLDVTAVPAVNGLVDASTQGAVWEAIGERVPEVGHQVSATGSLGLDSQALLDDEEVTHAST